MSDATPHLGLPLIAAAQAQKHVTHNEALGLLDALVQLACLDKDLSAPPPSPSEGDRYLVTAASPSGAWAGLSGHVVRFQDGVWTGAAPRPGWFAWVIDEADLYIFDGSGWTSFRRTVTAIQLTGRLGINTAADGVNRLALKSDGALLSWDDATPGSGDMRVAVNKQAAARDAGLVFQTGYAARALIGTLGSDDFSVKVSGDGATFSTALTASSANGGIDFASTDTVLAAAATVDLGLAGTRRVVITGSAAITGFGGVPNRERFLRFTGGASLVHDAGSLVLPTRATIVTAADDTCIATSDAAGNWRVRHYQRADGTPLAGGGTIASVAGRTGAVTLASADLTDATAVGRSLVAASSAAAARAGLSAAASGANADITALAGPALGAATAATAAAGTSTAQVATTAFVAASFLTTGSAAATYAPLASPALTGTPTAPNAAAGTNTAQIATTSFVAASFVTYAYAAASYATIASPTLTGTPTAPTPAARDNSTKLATTAYADRGDAAATARTQVNDAAYAILPADRTVAVIALSAARTLTLPAASAYPQGVLLTIMDESGACSAANALTVARAGASDAIDGLASVALVTAYGYVALQSNGANKWTVVDRATVSTRNTFADVAKAATQSIPYGTFTRIVMAAVNQDTGSNWDSANSWYTCPRSGIYLITGSIRVADGTAAGSTYSCGVYTSETDGPWHLWTGVGPSPASRATFAYSRLSYQAAGDRLRMFAFTDASGGMTIMAAGLQIMLVSEAA